MDAGVTVYLKDAGKGGCGVCGEEEANTKCHTSFAGYGQDRLFRLVKHSGFVAVCNKRIFSDGKDRAPSFIPVRSVQAFVLVILTDWCETPAFPLPLYRCSAYSGHSCPISAFI